MKKASPVTSTIAYAIRRALSGERAFALKPSLLPGQFLENRQGGVAILFALAFLPLLLMTAGAIDYAQATKRRSVLQAAADSAVLAGVQRARTDINGGVSQWNSDGVVAAQNIFFADARSVPGASASPPTIGITLNGGLITGALSFSVKAPTSMLGMIGLPTITLGGAASATLSVKQYTDVHIVIDVSDSMGIGATVADQQTLFNAIGCQLACHYLNSTLPAARASGATLRIDVVKTALAASLASIPQDGTTRVAIYTFSNSLKNIFPLSSVLSGAIAAVNQLDITGDPFGGGTDSTYALGQLNAQLSQTGNGLTSSAPRGVVMLATDGVQDDEWLDGSFNWGNDSNFVLDPVHLTDGYGVTFEAFNASACSAIKSKGYTLMTLQTTYVIPNNVDPSYNTRLNYIKNTLSPLVATNLSNCASTPGNYFQANLPNEISAAVSNMFGSMISLRLTK
ncbi:VWA domain-containing protein [Methylocystis heyeri]|uniref:VWA domain-containing protein n=1 Tax=Methylocystis heyeri TaxID=391905 RepID=A0A6B8KJ48_9HYPH|nr:VWA domain-containing protein [Methylocystis heyeri]QGM47647.1 VWA domain-containing protein [Methylocystis heyeri]